MSKKIIHFQIPLLQNGLKDDLAINTDYVNQFIKLTQEKLGKKYIIIASPFIPSGVDGITIKDFTEMDLKSFIEKFGGENER
nr:MAG TPA: hypothetical protein [Caudoviricetes sp.]